MQGAKATAAIVENAAGRMKKNFQQRIAVPRSPRPIVATRGRAGAGAVRVIRPSCHAATARVSSSTLSV